MRQDRCKLQQASAHLHQVIEGGVIPAHTVQSVGCVAEVYACGKVLLTEHNLRQHAFKIYIHAAYERLQLH